MSEWTKLRPCFYLAENGRPATSHLCVICAETLVAWEWLMFNSPIQGAHTYTVWRRPRIHKIRMADRIEEADQPQNAYVVVELGDTVLTAWSLGTGTPIRYKIKGQDMEHTADNIYALRSKILNTVPF